VIVCTVVPRLMPLPSKFQLHNSDKLIKSYRFLEMVISNESSTPGYLNGMFLSESENENELI
jgi:hypothetical protein